MKKILLLSCFYGAVLSCAAALSVQLSYCTFYSRDIGPYIEVYLAFEADHISLQKSEAGFYGDFGVLYQFFQGENLVLEENFSVKSPLFADTTGGILPFVSQNRMFIPNGDYVMKISIRDLNSSDSALVTNQNISVNYGDQFITLSDIELFQSSQPSNEDSPFQKNGFEIIPYAYDIVPKELGQIGFYAELYNADKMFGADSSFLITYYLEDYEEGSVTEGFRGFTRKKASDINIIMGKFLIDKLSRGNYYLRIDVLNRTNQLILTKRIAFHKENEIFVSADAYTSSFVDRYISADSLAEHIKYLQPVADQMEWEFAQNQLSNKDLAVMKKYFLNFWMQRNQSEPEKAWAEYYRLVRIVNENFGSPMRPGYLSDRGYRYLKYGPPDDRYESFDEPHAYPYEAWWYNKVNKQSNRIIIFANKSQVLNDYVILHSDINGELYNKDWNLELHRMTPGVVDDEKPAFMDHFGNKSQNYMNMPR